MRYIILTVLFLVGCGDNEHAKWKDKIHSARIVRPINESKPIFNKCGDFKGFEKGQPYLEIVTEKESVILHEEYKIYKDDFVLTASEVRYK